MFIRSLSMQPRAIHWRKAAISSVLFMGAVLGTGNTVLAQISPDSTLPSNSIVTPSGKTFVIEGGTQAGNNLFHSFTQFSLPTNNTAYINNTLSIQNIFGRVTGSELSNIDGLIKANGIANLFLLNPNGIIFGPNARLDVGGSFVASTANSIKFADGTLFSAKAAQTSSLLSVNIPIGLQLNANPNNISNAGSLTVNSGENITLLGGAVNHTGSLTAPGGTVQVLGKQVGLFDHASIDVSSQTGGGTVLIGGDVQGRGTVPNAARTYVGPNVTIKADALTTGNGGNVVVWADEATGFYGNISSRGGSVSGNGGFVEVSGKQHLIFRGNVNTNASVGIPGTLLLDPTNITIANGSGDAAGDGTDTFAGDNSSVAGSILSASLSQINDTAPTTIYESELEGLSGNTNIVLQATNDITLQNLADNTLNLATGSGRINFTADADADGVGNFVMDVADTIRTNGRDIAISGASLSLGNIDTSLILPGQFLGAVNIDGGGPIPPSSTNGSASFTFTVPDLGNNIGDLDVLFSAAHTWDSDLNVTLTSPQGTVFNLFSAVGGDGDNFQDTVLDDSAANSITTSSAPFIGRFRPSGTGGLAVFNGENPAGSWTLNVTDTFLSADNGTVYRAGDTAPWGTALGTQLLFTSPISVRHGAINLNATNGSLNVGSLNANIPPASTGITRLAAGDINLTGNEINLNNTVAGLGNLTLQPSNPNQAIAIGGIDSGSANTLNLTGAEINRLQNGFNSIIIGGANSSGAVSLAGNVSFVDPVILRSPVGSGSINTTGFELTGGDNATISLLANQNITTGNISNPARNITLTSNNGGINTTAGVIEASSNLSESSSNAIVTLRANQDITTGNILNTGRQIQITSTNGNINIPGIISTSTNQFTNDPTPYSAGDIFIDAARNLTISGEIRANSFIGAGGNISLTSGNNLSIIDGAFVNSETNIGNGTGSSPVGGNINLTAPLIELENSSRATVNIIGTGQGGSLFANADEVRLINGGGLNSSTEGIGTGGDIIINTRRLLAQNTIPASEINFNNLDEFRTGVTTFVRRFPDTSSADFIDFISGRRDSLFERGDFDTGRGGNITINASESVELIGNQPGAFSPTLSLETVRSAVRFTTGISTGTIANGASGNLTINTGRLVVQNGAGITTTSLSPGSLPDIFPEIIPSFVDGRIIPQNPFLIFVRPLIINTINTELTRITGAGEAGNLKINANQIDLQGAGGLTTATLSDSRAGNLSINANQITLRDGAAIAASTLFGAGDAGELTITTDQLSIRSGSRVGGGTAGEGSGGIVTVTAIDSIELSGRSPDNPSDITTFAEEGSIGDAGELNVTTRQLIVSNGAEVSATTSGAGGSGKIYVRDADLVSLDNGSITTAVNPTSVLNNTTNQQSGIDIQTRRLSLMNGARVTASTSGIGNAGSITVRQADSVALDNSSISTAVNTNAIGQGGDIEIQTRNLSLSNGAQVSAATSGIGDAGDITIRDAESVSLSQSAISSEATATNSNGGDVTINTQRLSVQDNSEVSAAYVGGASQNANLRRTNSSAALNDSENTASTVNGRQAGDLTINATESVSLSGNSNLSVEATEGGTAGNLRVNTGQFDISEKSEVSVSSLQGQAGNVEITADSLSLNQGRITAVTGSGEQEGANIRLQRLNIFLLRNESLISANATGNANGGNIDINSNFLIALPPTGSEGSDIIANAIDGNGGRIDVNSQAIFGIQFQPNRTPGNDFTVSSGSGAQGEVQINTVNEPNSTLTELPENLVDSSGLIGQNACQQISDSEFNITGRGGLPPTPNETLGGDVVWSDTRPRSFASQTETTRKLAHTQNFIPNVKATPIISATGWLFNNKGEVTLVANAQNTTAESFKTYSATCSQR